MLESWSLPEVRTDAYLEEQLEKLISDSMTNLQHAGPVSSQCVPKVVISYNWVPPPLLWVEFIGIYSIQI